MADHIFNVMSQPPDDVPVEEFKRWYDVHVRQILELPGWVAAEQYALTFVRSSLAEPPKFSYLVRYEIDGSFEAAWAALRQAVDSGNMEMADWFPRLTTCGWEGTPSGDRLEAAAA